MRKRMQWPLLLAIACAASLSGCDRGTKADQASIKADPSLPPLKGEQAELVTLGATIKPHWAIVNDASFDRPVDSRAVLVDLDSRSMLGMVSGGYNQMPLMINADGRGFAQLSTFYSRGSRGERTDVITEYLFDDLAPGRETIVPPKAIKVMPLFAAAQLTDDGRFALVSNFTPQQSITVVDRQSGGVVGEFPTPGCGLVYPVGERRFMVHCSDGGLAIGALDTRGAATFGAASAPVSPMTDPVNEKPIRVGKTQWLFISFAGQAFLVDGGGAVPRVLRRWSLLGQGDKGWLPGGLQPAAFHRATGEAYILMHEGGPHTHKDPGTEIWVFDVQSGKRVRKIPLESPATTVAVTPGERPRLLTVMFGASDALTIYDPKSGKKLGEIGKVGQTLGNVQTAPEIW